MPPEPSSRTRLALGALLAVALVALAGCSYAPPPSVCAVCDEGMSRAAAAHDVNVTVSHAELHLHLRPDGSARWVARVQLDGPGVDDLRTDDALRRRVVERRLANDTGPAPDAHTNISTSMTGDTIVVAFDDPALADRHVGGVLVVDRFNTQTRGSAGPPPFQLRADRMVLHPPDGWRVLNRPPGATARPRAVVWRTHVSERTYVAVGPTDTTAAHQLGQVGIAAEVSEWALPPIVAGSVVPVLLLLAGVVVAFQRYGDAPRRGSGDGVDHALAASVGTTAVALLGAFGLVAVAHRDISQFLGALVSPLAGPNGGNSLLALVALLVVLLVPPVAAFAAAGVVADRRAAIRWPPAVVAVATAPLEVTLLVLTTPAFGFLIAIVMAVWAVLAVGAGVLAFVGGRRLARSQGWTRRETTAGDERDRGFRER